MWEESERGAGPIRGQRAQCIHHVADALAAALDVADLHVLTKVTRREAAHGEAMVEACGGLLAESMSRRGNHEDAIHLAGLQRPKARHRVAEVWWSKYAALARLQLAERAKLIADYRERFGNPYDAAARGYIDAVIRPRETRKRLIRGLEVARHKRDVNPPKKHGNIPL